MAAVFGGGAASFPTGAAAQICSDVVMVSCSHFLVIIGEVACLMILRRSATGAVSMGYSQQFRCATVLAVPKHFVRSTVVHKGLPGVEVDKCSTADGQPPYRSIVDFLAWLPPANIGAAARLGAHNSAQHSWSYPGAGVKRLALGRWGSRSSRNPCYRLAAAVAEGRTATPVRRASP